jgi:hypothetical protein
LNNLSSAGYDKVSVSGHATLHSNTSFHLAEDIVREIPVKKAVRVSAALFDGVT